MEARSSHFQTSDTGFLSYSVGEMLEIYSFLTENSLPICFGTSGRQLEGPRRKSAFTAEKKLTSKKQDFSNISLILCTYPNLAYEFLFILKYIQLGTDNSEKY